MKRTDVLTEEEEIRIQEIRGNIKYMRESAVGELLEIVLRFRALWPIVNDCGNLRMMSLKEYQRMVDLYLCGYLEPPLHKKGIK